MKKYYFLVVGFLFFGLANAQIVNIPDANFKAKLLLASPATSIAENEIGNRITIDTNQDGEIQESEAALVYHLNVSESHIIDLTGINFFLNLTELHCNRNNLNSLDIISLANIYLLDCFSNQIVSLTLNNNAPFVYLNVRSNELNELNILNFTNILYLDCAENNISNLDLSSSINLLELFCYRNILTSLDLSLLTQLNYLNCSYNQLSQLNVSSLVNLFELYFNDNLVNSINLSSLTELKVLNCGANSLSTVDISSLNQLNTLFCNGNQLTFLDVNALINLENLSFGSNSISTIEINNLINLRSLDCSNNQFTSLNITNLINLRSLDCSNNQLVNLDISNFKYLEYFYCSNNGITNLDLSDLKLISSINCSNNQLSQLDVSNLAFLYSLNCSYNSLTSLDTRSSPFLHVMNCRNNLITTINTNSIHPMSIDGFTFTQNPIANFCCNTIDVNNLQNYLPANCIITTDCPLPFLSPFAPSFKQKLLQYPIVLNYEKGAFRLDLNNDGEIQQFEANQVYGINISVSTDLDISPVTSLDGVIFFPNLEDLDCRFTTLSNPEWIGLSNLKTLDCSDAQLTSLNLSNLANLKSLNCSNNHMLSTIDVSPLINLEYLNCIQSFLTNITFGNNTKLKKIDADNNDLTSISVATLTNLESLNLNYNETLAGALDLSSISFLKYLYINVNQITSLNLGNNNLIELQCNQNLLTTIDVSASIGLNKLYCEENLLTTLDLTNNTELIRLECSNNQLNSLNVSSNSVLEELNCNFNQLNTIDVSNNTLLAFLDCSNNLLSNINLTSNTFLYTLNCQENQLTSLDLSNNDKIVFLYCNYNQLTSLNLINNALYGFGCTNNQLISLFLKNGYNENFIDFSNNPTLQYICADDSQITTIQNLINNYGIASTCHVNSFCSFTPGGTFYNINGKNRFDSNSNGCDDIDIAIPNFKLAFSDTSLTSANIIPDLTGNYSIPLQEGTYTITPTMENPTYFSISPATAIITLPEIVNPYIQDFCITANGVHDDLEVAVFPVDVARPGFDATYKIIYKNKGTNSQSGNLNFVFDDSVLDLVSALPTFTSQTINNLSWDYSNLLPFESREVLITLNVNAPTETPAINNNDILTYNVLINGLVDETPSDNIATLNQTVVNSFDPNDKTCLEGNFITPSMIGKYVHYKIRFENTGTFPAQNIVVTDRIDTSIFDISTLQPVNGSHTFTTRITDTNKVEFIFQNIFLPFDDATNDGYLVFKIKTWPTLSLGDELTNTANIYFDYNFPIETNTATTIIANQLAVADFEFSAYISISPNPAKETLNVNIKDIEVSSITIYNTLGQLVQVIPNAKQIKIIDVSELKSGNYFIKVVSDKGASSSKFIKE